MDAASGEEGEILHGGGIVVAREVLVEQVCRSTVMRVFPASCLAAWWCGVVLSPAESLTTRRFMDVSLVWGLVSGSMCLIA